MTFLFRSIIHFMRSPGDIGLAVTMLVFLYRTPGDLSRLDVHSFLEGVRGARRPRSTDVPTAMRRIVRLRNRLLRMPLLRSRNTCYVRALTLYRFLDPGERLLRLHIGVERGSHGERLRGHAWVTIDGEILEGPDAVLANRVEELTLERRANTAWTPSRQLRT